MASALVNPITAPKISQLRDKALRGLRASWLYPLNDTDAINDLLGSFNPRWSLTDIRAELVAREQQTADTVTLSLRPNRLWAGFRAGQHVTVTVDIDGVRHHRVYSLSSDPAQPRLLSITVKRQSGGRVSNWLHDALRVGDIVTLSPADGDFTLPADAGDLLLLSAGSGITPMHALLRELRARRGYKGSVVLVHVCRNADDQIFARELQALASDWPALRIVSWHSTTRGRPTPDALLAEVPDHAQRNTYLCGPTAFMSAIEAHWAALGRSEALRLERFGLAPRVIEGGAAADVRCSRSERAFVAEAGEALLPAAERAGLKPAYGCRIGVCRSCLCKKRSGTVENLISGEQSSEPDEWIRLCVSTPRSDLELDI